MFTAWREFRRGKENKRDVARFLLELEDHIFSLHEELSTGKYRHSSYEAFYLQDPKLRHIHKASVIDRLLHHAITRNIQPLFEHRFIFDSYSSRKAKGSHRAVKRLRQFAWRLSHNNTKTVWVLKCDIKKYFDNIDHDRLIRLVGRRIGDGKLRRVIEAIIRSIEIKSGCGVPLGNLTSQLFSNVYLDSLDQFVKRTLRVKYYIRYADDFILLDTDRTQLVDCLSRINSFLQEKLKLELNEGKIQLRTWHQGIDFLGYVLFPQHTILRPKTKRRILHNIRLKLMKLGENCISLPELNQCIASYFGMLKHCRGEGIRYKIEEIMQ